MLQLQGLDQVYATEKRMQEQIPVGACAALFRNFAEKQFDQDDPAQLFCTPLIGLDIRRKVFYCDGGQLVKHIRVR